MLTQLFSFKAISFVIIILIITYRLIICINPLPEFINGETNNVWNAIKVSQGNTIYNNPEKSPYEIFQYTPLSQLPIIIISYFFFNNQLEDIPILFNIGRFFSLLCNLITSFIVFKLLKNLLKIPKELALIGFALSISLLPHHNFGIRPDALTNLITTYSIYLFLKAYFSTNIKLYIIAGIFFALSFFSKQDGFIILSALGILLLIKFDIKSILYLCISFGISFLFLFFISNLILGDQFIKSIFGGVKMDIKLDQLIYIFKRYLYLYLPFIITYFISLVLLIKKIKNKKVLPLVILSLMSFIIAAGTSLKPGSHYNYYTINILIGVIVIIYTFNIYILEKKYKHLIIASSISLIFCFTSFQQVYHYTSPSLKFITNKKEYKLYTDQLKPLIDYLETKDGYIFSSSYILKLVLWDRILFPNTEFYSVSKFNYESYSALNEKEKISFFVINRERNINELFNALKNIKFDKNYTLKKRFKNYDIYELKH